MVNIQGIEYPVTVMDNDTMTTLHKNPDILGYWDMETGIEINDNLMGDTKIPVLMHEILHGINNQLGIGIDEHQTQLLATGFIQLLQANGGEVGWLRDMLEVE